jgi:hypothetical protein
MPQLTLHFQTCIQLEHLIRTGHDAAVYRATFAIVQPNHDPVANCFCEVKCAAGAQFTDPGALEVGPPLLSNGKDYRGAWNQQEFSLAVGRYILAAFKRTFGIGPGATNIAMVNNLIGFPATAIINVPATPPGGIW